jgi:hypothetical protein
MTFIILTALTMTKVMLVTGDTKKLVAALEPRASKNNILRERY